ncbi:MAG: hypothetical protein ABS76_24025 [Pelagibacterium sp. SCN 64-44]|nr:MAG: hypothetical protein ABS76_24025 [Pelagibacterium sp. SCN 64-44]
MRRFALVLALTACSALPALAQAYQGNWSCRDATAERAGIFTLYGQVYGWASRVAGDANSGSGTLTPYQDGVGLNDGNLRVNGNVQAVRMVNDPTYGVALQMETADAIVMLCTPR